MVAKNFKKFIFFSDMEQTWFFPAPGEGSVVNYHPPQNIEQLVNSQELEIERRQAEIIASRKTTQQEFHHIVTGLEEK